MKNLFLCIVLFFSVFFVSQSAVSQSKKTDTELIENLIVKKKEFNKEYSFGHRIQLYNGFEKEARAIHYGDSPERSIYGKTTIKEAKSLYEDGIPVTPLPWVDRKTN